MATVKLYYDVNGRIRETVRPPIFATSKKVDKIEAYTDFNSINYVVSIAFKRADGIVLGSYPMSPVVDVNGRTYHFYDLDFEDTRIPGPLQLTIRYETMQEDPITGELVLTQSKPTSMTEIYIYESVDDAKDKLSLMVRELNELKSRIKDVEDGSVHQDAIEAIEEQIELLESKIGEAGDSHYLGDDLPDFAKYKIWFSPSDLEEDIEEQVFNLMMKTKGSELIIDSPKTTEEILLIDKQQEEVLVLDTNAEYAPILVERTINKEILVMEKQKEVLVIETNDI